MRLLYLRNPTIIYEDDQGVVSSTVFAGLEAADPLRWGGAGKDRRSASAVIDDAAHAIVDRAVAHIVTVPVVKLV